jgi:putative SOS response-associated peptidase YedK
MCARYTMFATPAEIMGEFDFEDENFTWDPRYNVAPAQLVPIITNDSFARRVKIALWGFTPCWQPEDSLGSINARSETIFERPMFRSAIKKHRCLVPTTGFYEWKHEGKVKQPFLIGLQRQKVFGLAGICEERDGVLTMAILTTSPNALVEEIHDRMPVIVAREGYARWLDPKFDPARLSGLLGPFPAEAMVARPVDRRVGNPRFDDSSLVEPPRS